VVPRWNGDGFGVGLEVLAMRRGFYKKGGHAWRIMLEIEDEWPLLNKFSELLGIRGRVGSFL